MDIDGSGRLGDLKSMTFENIFYGKIANEFRETLNNQKLPILRCVRCHDLNICRKDNSQTPSLPDRGILIETNANCNLSCITCGRLRRTSTNFQMSTYELIDILKQLKKFDLKMVHLYAFGEPFISKEIYDQVEAIRKIMPHVFVTASTNGMLIDSDEKYLAALLMDNIIFSIDGSSQETCRRYQVGIDFRRSYENMCELVKLRKNSKQRKPYIIWKYLVFRWNDRGDDINKAIDLARRAEVDALAFWFTKSPFYGMSWRFFLNRQWQTLAPLRDHKRVLYFGDNPGIYL